MAADGKLSFLGEQMKLVAESDAAPVVARMSQRRFRVLEMTNNTLGEGGAKPIAKELEQHPELEECLFNDFFTGRLKTEIPPALGLLFNAISASGARLTVLDLSDNAFGPVVAPTLVRFLKTDAAFSLKVLNLNNEGLGITGGTQIAEGLEACHELSGGSFALRVFVAGRNRLETPTAKALAKAFKKIGTLEEVSMPQNGIYPAGIEALADAFQANPNLRIINLSDNTVKKEGAEYLHTAMLELPKLEVVGLRDCLLKSTGARWVVDALMDHEQLTSLQLDGNEIGPDTAIEIVSMFADVGAHDMELTLTENCYGSRFHEVQEAIESAHMGDAGGSDDDQGSLSDDEEENDDDYEDVEDEDEAEGEEEEEAEAEDYKPLPPGTSPLRRDVSATSSATGLGAAAVPANFSFTSMKTFPGSPFASPAPAFGPTSSFGGNNLFREPKASVNSVDTPTTTAVPFSFAPAKIAASNVKNLLKNPSFDEIESMGATSAMRIDGIWDKYLKDDFLPPKLPKELPPRATSDEGILKRKAGIEARMRGELRAIDALTTLLCKVSGLLTPSSSDSQVALVESTVLLLTRKALGVLRADCPRPLCAYTYILSVFNHLVSKSGLCLAEEDGAAPSYGSLRGVEWVLGSEELWAEADGERPFLSHLVARQRSRGAANDDKLADIFDRLAVGENKENQTEA